MKKIILLAFVVACDDEILDTPPTAQGVHPSGYAAAGEHGHDAKFQELECTECHGDDLTGGTAGVSCDACHETGWRENCTFCHGDPEEGSGSPPVHLSGVDDGVDASFIPHRVHTSATDIKAAFDCNTCHTTPTDVLSVGHIFVSDSTPGRAEANFVAGLSPAADWDGNGTCSNLYCHGNGQGANGEMDHDGSVDSCHDCHADWTSSENTMEGMSGEHWKHVGDVNIDCEECHGATVNGSNAIIDVAMHVNGTVEVEFLGEMTRSNGECTGTCHNEDHNGRDWD